MKTRKVRECTANDQFLVTEGIQCGNCLGLNGKHNKPSEAPTSVASHTPTPWEVQSDGNREVFIRRGDKPIARMSIAWGNDPDANADFIVRAVNSHEELVSKLKTFRAIMIAKGDQAAYVAELEALIAKAEGK